MTAIDAPVEPVRQRQPVAEREPDSKINDVKPETSTNVGTDFATRIGLTAGNPTDTLKLLGELTRHANLTGMPDYFGKSDGCNFSIIHSNTRPRPTAGVSRAVFCVPK